MPLNSSCRANGDIIISSGDRLTIENAVDFTRLAREALETASPVVVEFEAQVEIDITGVQVLCSACKSAAVNGSSFTYGGPQPQGLAAIMAACGAGRHAACKHISDVSCIWFGGAE